MCEAYLLSYLDLISSIVGSRVVRKKMQQIKLIFHYLRQLFPGVCPFAKLFRSAQESYCMLPATEIQLALIATLPLIRSVGP